jgi:hypothetical protein
MTDRSSAILAGEHRTIGDHFDFNLFERPMTSQAMDYQPFLDISPRAELSLAPPWVYVTIYLQSKPAKDAEVTYAVELDLNINGRGDWLITAKNPFTEEWTSSGVEAFLDSNGDVGGRHASRSDSQPGDGFDALILGHGEAIDPEGVWVRLAPLVQAVQIAFKHGLIGDDQTFLWSVWADGGPQRPDWFDYNDHYSLAEAGSPNIGSSNYPLKALASVDNTCRWIQGIMPRIGMPGLCVFATSTPIATPTPSNTPSE